MTTACGTDEKVVRSYLGIEIPSQALDQRIEERMQSLGIPGVSIVVLNRGEVVYHRTIGFANVEESIPVGETTIFGFVA
ncbi:MAG: serine hydrolase [Opitutales bacterium]|nr:serine hydrolase [Opitutales bacterium]